MLKSITTIAFLATLSASLYSQSSIVQTENTGPVEPYVQIGISDYPLSPGSYGVMYWGEGKNPEIVKADGKNKGHKFESIAAIFNYLDRQGYVFVMEITKVVNFDNQKNVYLFVKN